MRLPSGANPFALLILLGLIVLAGLFFVLWRRTKKGGWLALFLVVVVGGAAAVTYRVRTGRAGEDPLADGVAVAAVRGEIAEVVEASGNLVPLDEASATFSTAGRLAEICVESGERVREGDVLGRLDTADLELQLSQAGAGLDLAEANLAKLLAQARPEDVEVAQSTLDQALASQDELRVALDTATEQARLTWVQAANALRDAQANYENIYWDNRELEDRLAKYDQELPDANVDAEAQAWRAVENAEAAMEQARLSYEQAVQRRDTSLRTARAQVDSARANLERLTNGAGSEDIAAAQAAVAQSRIAVDLAQAQLDKAVLTAPIDGVVATILVDVHDQVSAAMPVLTLLDISSYYVDVEVDEVDIPQTDVGQKTWVFLDALPEVELVGEVSEIALSPSVGMGVVTYRVRVRLLDLQGAPVMPGMSANVHIVVLEAADALIVPRRAVRSEEGQFYVERVTDDDQLETVPVELGLEDPFYVEILSGLEEGERVFVRGVVERNQIQQILEEGPGSAQRFRP